MEYKVLHAPLDIAGQSGLICEYLRRIGFPSVSYNYFPSYLRYQNRAVETDSYQLHKMFEAAANHFDLFHFHNGSTFFNDFRDLPYLREKGKKIVMHHRGNDVRFSQKARKGAGYTNPYVYTGNSLPDEAIERNLSIFSKLVDTAIVQDYELYHYVRDYYDKVYVLPRLIDLEKTPSRIPSVRKLIPRIVHAPTDRAFKGSEDIIRTLQQLQREAKFEFVLLERMSHEEAMRQFLQADIVIDQIRCGAYGNVSVEAMAMGKPVVAYLRDDLLAYYPESLPIVSAHPDNLKTKLKELIQDAELRRSLGQRGRLYVEEHHDARLVIRQLLDIYFEILGTNS
jgi:glycosyltransferase involved in cell wall biosynthesis